MGSLGWVRPSRLRARVSLAWPGPGDPPRRVRWPLGPYTPDPLSSLASQECAHPRAPFSPAWLALIQLSLLHATGPPRPSRPRRQREGEPLASRLGLPERAPPTCS